MLYCVHSTQYSLLIYWLQMKYFLQHFLLIFIIIKEADSLYKFRNNMITIFFDFRRGMSWGCFGLLASSWLRHGTASRLFDHDRPPLNSSTSAMFYFHFNITADCRRRQVEFAHVHETVSLSSRYAGGVVFVNSAVAWQCADCRRRRWRQFARLCAAPESVPNVTVWGNKQTPAAWRNKVR